MKNKKLGALKNNFLRRCTLSNLKQIIKILVPSKLKGDYINLLLHVSVDCNMLSRIASCVIIYDIFCLSKVMTRISFA